MKKIVLFFSILIIAGILGASWLVLSFVRTNTNTKASLETAQSGLAKKEAEIASLKAENESLKSKVDTARSYATFLFLAFCPTLEAGDKNSLCMNDGATWLIQTIQAGTAISDPMFKGGMETITQALGNSKKLSSKQFYELLKPLEARALQAILLVTEN